LQAAQRFFVLTQTDNLWKEHLQAIKFLQQAVSLRGYAQVPCVKNPNPRHTAT
jgi:preprotein translocase subunit SecA